jgi:hypothetical protein
LSFLSFIRNFRLKQLYKIDPRFKEELEAKRQKVEKVRQKKNGHNSAKPKQAGAGKTAGAAAKTASEDYDFNNF